MAYIGGPKADGCIFCDKPRADDRREALVLAANASASVLMNRFPYANGHLMVAPRRHTADVNALAEREFVDLMSALRRSMVLLREVLGPEGMNVGLNLGRAAGAGITEHMHWHIVPRWVGDVNFMPMLAEVRVVPEHLEAMYDRLRPVFAELDADH